MSWIRRKIGQVKGNSRNNKSVPLTPQDSSIVRYEVFKSHWSQVAEIIAASSVGSAVITTKETAFEQSRNVTQDDVDSVRNLLEQMTYLLAEEQTSGLQLGPILEYIITEDIFNRLFLWSEHSGNFREQIFINQIKVYEVTISQAQHSFLHHRQLVNPMLKLLSSCSNMNSEEVDGHAVILLNLLCVWINRDPTLLDVFFQLSDDQGPANFLVFSLLIEFIHREGSVGQQARDALLLCMTLSSEDDRVAQYIISTNFCPVLATGLSGLYSSLPRQIDIRADEWHFLRKQDWNNVPSLINFMNSLEFCNSVVEAAMPSVAENLLDYIYNGFLVSVFGPALHKSSADEVIVTTAYLNLFLQSVSAPPLLQCFLRFLLCHHHDNSLIINTLIQRIGSNSRLALVSLSLFRTLVDLDCEDFMLHLIFRYLAPCHHILASQRRSMRDTDMYSASALRFISLTPSSCMERSNNEIVAGDVVTDLSLLKPTAHPDKVENGGECEDPEESSELKHSPADPQNVSVNACEEGTSTVGVQNSVVTSPSTMAEFGPDLRSQIALHTSYMDYLEDAKDMITSCREACESWSAVYDGENAPGDMFQDEHSVSTARIATYGSTPCLRKNEVEFVEMKGHSVSDPEVIAGNRPNLSSPALQALRAAYKAITITTNALTQDSDPNHEAANGLDCNIPHDYAPTKQREQNINHSISANKEEEIKKAKTKEQLELTIPETEENIEPVSNTVTDKLTVGESNGKIPVSPVQPVSSVDEFFRALMESVPTNARESIEKTSPKFEQERLNGTRKSSTDAIEVTDDDLEDTSLDTEDWDDEEDQGSINSSSFYEPEVEYVPTDLSLVPETPLKMHSAPYTGPFLSTLFGKVDQMATNSLYENLLLTGIISRLACYPQPLLRSFLLNTQVVFHPAVRSLYQILNGVRNRIDSYAAGVNDFIILVRRAQKYLLYRGMDPLSLELKGDNLIQDTPMPVPRVKTKNTVLGEVFLRRKKRRARSKSRNHEKASEPAVKRSPFSMGILSQKESSKFYSGMGNKPAANNSNDVRIKNTVYAAVILNEFLKELAAISQEHAVSIRHMM